MFDSVGTTSGRGVDRFDPAALAALPKSERLALLRQRMAGVTSRVDRAAPPPAESVAAPDLISVPGPLGDLLPHAGLVKGTVVSCTRGAVLLALIAAASAANLTTALVCGPQSSQLGLLAAWEMGTDLERLALVETGADRAAEVVGVLMSGVPMIVVDMPGQLRMRPKVVEGLRARARTCGSVLVVTGGDWARRPHLGLEVRRRAATGLGRGCGRVREIEYEITVRDRGQLHTRATLALTGGGDGRTRWSRPDAVPVELRPGWARTG